MSACPVRVEARLEEPLNRGLWIVKWLLAIPHYIVLGFLWAAFCALTIIAFFAILFTGRYPRPLFDFNVGVLRWTWRVAYYTYGALGTDRYPPFTLGPAPGYPATLDVDYPERLSRGLVLVKWWLLAIPHYLVVGMFTSGSLVFGRDDLPDRGGVLHTLDWGGVIGLLVLIAAFALLFTGHYPRGVFDLVVGMNRWALRVAAYATLMTDAYPPFRLDQGGQEAPRPGPPPPAARAPARHGAGSVVALAVGAVLAFNGIAAAVGGAGTALLDASRDSDGYVGTGAQRLATTSYALVSEEIEVAGQGVSFLRENVGRIRVEASGSATPLFVGIARQDDVAAYLGGVAHDRVTHPAITPGTAGYDRYPGSAAPAPPSSRTFWAVSGGSSVTWDVEGGDWAVVVMNADGSPGVEADLRPAATLPGLGTATAVLLVGAVVLLTVGGALILAGVRRPAAPSPEPAVQEPVH
jgi:hypothetical protein